MTTFAERLCAERKCSRDDFMKIVFTECLHRRAIVLVPLVRLFRRDYFLIDWDLIAVAADATTLVQVQREVREFMMDSRNHGWWRRRANLRLSGGRLIRLAARYLPDSQTSL